MAQMVQAYNFKILIELMQSNLKAANFYAYRNKITLREADDKQKYMGDLLLETTEFKEYILDIDYINKKNEEEDIERSKKRDKEEGEEEEEEEGEKGGKEEVEGEIGKEAGESGEAGGSKTVQDSKKIERKEEKLKIGFNIGHMHIIMKTIKKKDTLTLTILRDKPKEMKIKIENKDKGRCSESVIKLTNVAKNEWQTPHFDGLPNAVMNSSEFQKACKVMNTITTKVHIRVQEKSIQFSTDKESIVDRKEYGGSKWVKGGKVLYYNIFSNRKFSQLAKYAGLSSDNQMKFYASENIKPLLVTSKVGSMGRYSSYVMADESRDEEEEDDENGDTDERDEEKEDNEENEENEENDNDEDNEDNEEEDGEKNKKKKEAKKEGEKGKKPKKRILIIKK